MLKLTLGFCLCAYLAQEIHGQAIPPGSPYQVRLFDYSPAKDQTPQEVIQNNVRYIVTEMDKPANPEVLIFPEYGITGVDALTHSNISAFAIKIPDVDPGKALCQAFNVDPTLNKLACGIATKTPLKVLVVNLLEIVDNDIYNTNLVFNEIGAILAKYRKINLNDAEKSILTAGTEPVTFLSSFGVTFGLITSDDILHKTPSQVILRDRAVTDVIMTSAWQSEVPFYSAIGLQDGYSRKNGINLLVSSISDPANYRGGSGTYSVDPRGNTAYVPRVPGNQVVSDRLRVLERQLPERACSEQINPRSLGNLTGRVSDINAHKTKPMSNTDQYVAKSILGTDASKTSFNDEFCKGKVCCKFDVQFATEIYNIKPVYKAVVSDSTCGIIACDNDDSIATCGSRDNELSRAVFNKITIEAKFEGKSAYQYLPVSTNLDLKNINFVFCDGSASMKLEVVSQTGLVYLGFIGETTSAGQSIASISLLGIVSIVLAVFKLSS